MARWSKGRQHVFEPSPFQASQWKLVHHPLRGSDSVGDHLGIFADVEVRQRVPTPNGDVAESSGPYASLFEPR
jgi:hypothetical protein